MRIDSSGDVGIGVADGDIFGRFYGRSVGIGGAAISKLQIDGTSYSGIDLGKGGTRYGEINASDAGLDLYSLGATTLKMYTNATERMRITSGGAVRIGTTQFPDSEKLTVAGAISVSSGTYNFLALRLDGGNSIVESKGQYQNLVLNATGASGSAIFKTADTDRMLILSGGDIQIPTDSAKIQLRSSGSTAYTSINRDASNNLVVRNTANNSIFALDNSGNLVIGGTLTQGSDISYKENIKPLESQLDIVNKLNPVSYNRIGKKENEIGFIAQEVEKLIPDLVSENPDGLKSLAYGNMTSILVKAIQELKAEVELLKTQINN
jgi:hypothetical protein